MLAQRRMHQRARAEVYLTLLSVPFCARSRLRGAALLASLQLVFGCSAEPAERSRTSVSGSGGTSTSSGGSAGAVAGGAAGSSGSGGTTAGTGGAAGSNAGTSSGGNAGTGGGGGGSGGTTGGDPCAGAAICDDFEAATIDSAWTPQMDSTPAPALDTTKFHSGAQSVKFVGSSQQSFLVAPVPAQAFRIRAYVNFENATTSQSGHSWFIVAADNATSGMASQIRLGQSTQDGTPMLDLNVYSTQEHTQFSNGAGDGCNGCWTNKPNSPFQFAADTWYCVEAFYNGPANEFQVWVDEEEVVGLHVTPTTMALANGGTWSPTYQYIKLGFGANTNPGAVWYDDVIVSTSAIGCQ